MWITIERGPDAGASVEVTGEVFTIGRNPAAKLVLTDPQVSSRHAAIEIAPDGSYLVRDLKSTNGTFIDGQRLEGAAPITGSERLRVGETEIQLSSRGAGAATVITPRADGVPAESHLAPAPGPPAPAGNAQPIARADGAPPASPAAQPAAAAPGVALRDPVAGRLLLVGMIGAAVALTLGIYGSAHTPASDLAITLGFTNTITMKVWLATIAIAFALVQLFSALWMYGRLPFGTAPSWLGQAHRISGRLAFIISLPVAYHCLYQLGFQHTSARVLAHSLLGCAFYGAFASKIVVVRSSKLPGFALPVAGGVAFTTLAGVWLTSGLWYISNVGFPSP
jgi:pSer/pThr/pTyr-binding forkhead associated (FHA) protein